MSEEERASEDKGGTLLSSLVKTGQEEGGTGVFPNCTN